MNAVEIEEAVSELAGQPFDSEGFSYSFLEAFGNKPTTIKRLRTGNSNKSDIDGGVLQRNNIHIAVCKEGAVSNGLTSLRKSKATVKAKAQFILATDGKEFQAENILSGETVVSEYIDFHEHFTFFLSLAGISNVKQICESAFDIKATGRLNKLYIELLRHNPDWASAQRRPDMNHFLARLIFCFFAEDTDIFKDDGLFTSTVQQMSTGNTSDTHEIISEIFRAMDTKLNKRQEKGIKSWASKFPYVNGELFSGSTEVPKFTKIARSYLIHVGNLDWKKINPDIFGSMIQAVADDDERGMLGMHYTSVPNILKVLNPLFLNDIRKQLEDAGENARKLLNLRKRISKIRIFDPACGSGNFLVIAYKQMREIENELNKRRGEKNRFSEIPLTNFRGIELRDFSAEIARLALIIAEYQSDIIHRGQQLALAEFLPLDAENWITKGNALRIDWLSVCPPTGTSVKLYGDDLFSTPLDQVEIDFENEGGETYMCGNPPFSGFNTQTAEQKSDLKKALNFTNDHKYFDYVSGWFYKAAKCLDYFDAGAFVSTNSIVQGVQVPIIWRPIFELGVEIFFGHETFIWKNNAANNAGVFCVIIGLSKQKRDKFIYYKQGFRKRVSNINGYITDAPNIFVDRRQNPISNIPSVRTGNVAYDGGNLIISKAEKQEYVDLSPDLELNIRPLTGSKEFIRGEFRYCIWIPNESLLNKNAKIFFKERFDLVKKTRESGGKIAKNYAHVPFRFYMTNESTGNQILVPRVSSIRRDYLPIGFLQSKYIISDSAQSIFNAPLWLFSVVGSKLHLAWAHTVSGKLKGDFRYSAIICYNTFPVPSFTKKNKEDLKNCAYEILIARERHFPATIADLYDPEKMPKDLRQAHERNDEVLERIYIGRRFKNDTERLEKLFELYTQMTDN